MAAAATTRVRVFRLRSPKCSGRPAPSVAGLSRVLVEQRRWRRGVMPGCTLFVAVCRDFQPGGEVRKEGTECRRLEGSSLLWHKGALRSKQGFF